MNKPLIRKFTATVNRVKKTIHVITTINGSIETERLNYESEDEWTGFEMGGESFDLHIYNEVSDDSGLSVSIYDVTGEGEKRTTQTSYWHEVKLKIEQA